MLSAALNHCITDQSKSCRTSTSLLGLPSLAPLLLTHTHTHTHTHRWPLGMDISKEVESAEIKLSRKIQRSRARGVKNFIVYDHDTTDRGERRQ